MLFVVCCLFVVVDVDIVVLDAIFSQDVFSNKPLVLIGRPEPQLRRGGRKMPH